MPKVYFCVWVGSLLLTAGLKVKSHGWNCERCPSIYSLMACNEVDIGEIRLEGLTDFNNMGGSLTKIFLLFLFRCKVVGEAPGE